MTCVSGPAAPTEPADLADLADPAGPPASRTDQSPRDTAPRVGAYWQERYRREAAKSWNLFYKRNETRFFKDRHWTAREFPQLFSPAITRVLEVGCGVGNFALPLAQDNPALKIYACDFSPRAIELFQADPRYKGSQCTAFVADLTAGTLAQHIAPASIDIVTCIFVLSALPPEALPAAIRNIKTVLCPGGTVLLRDYSHDDAAQWRFKPDRQLDESLFVRQDGTLAHYFRAEELEALFRASGFVPAGTHLVHAKTTNLKKDLSLDRLFVQAAFVLV